jgi:hypothetical protein
MIRSGQVTVETAGTAVQASTNTRKNYYMLRAHPDNSGDIFIGNDGANDVTSANGFALKSTDGAVEFVGRLSELYVDAEQNGDKLCWLLWVSD